MTLPHLQHLITFSIRHYSTSQPFPTISVTPYLMLSSLARVSSSVSLDVRLLSNLTTIFTQHSADFSIELVLAPPVNDWLASIRLRPQRLRNSNLKFVITARHDGSWVREDA